MDLPVRSQCDVATCERSVYARGWCSAHYQRWVKTGDVDGDRPLTKFGRKVPPEPGLMRSKELVKMLGVTYRQLDYWTRIGYIKPTIEAEGSGSTRWWAVTDVLHVQELLRRAEECPFDHGAMALSGLKKAARAAANSQL